VTPAEIAVESTAHAIGARRTHISVARARRLSRDGKHDAGHFHEAESVPIPESPTTDDTSKYVLYHSI
jgi:hypothetical protein